MSDQYSILCSPSCSYLINYQIQSNLYNWLDEKTEETQLWRLPAVGIWSASTAITSITRVMGIAEVFFKGAGILLSSPLSRTPCNNAKIGVKEIFDHAPKNCLRVAFIPVEFFVGTIENLIEPKGFAMKMAQRMKINLAHAKAGTLKGAEHERELGFMEANAKPKFMDYQDRMFRRMRAASHE